MALNPSLSTVLSDTQHCLLTQSMERGIIPQKLELVRVSRTGMEGGYLGKYPKWFVGVQSPVPGEPFIAPHSQRGYSLALTLSVQACAASAGWATFTHAWVY